MADEKKAVMYGDDGITILSAEAFDDLFERGLNPQPNEYLRKEMFAFWEKHGLPGKRGATTTSTTVEPQKAITADEILASAKKAMEGIPRREDPLANMFYRPMTMGGMDVHQHPDFVTVKRTWRERLLSWPWRPWVKTKQIPNPMFPTGKEMFRAFNTLHVTARGYAAIKDVVP